MIDLIPLAIGSLIETRTAIILGVLTILYILYYKKYGFYYFIQKKSYTIGKHRIGKTLPAFPNGWFVVLKSDELAVGETKYVDSHGESLAVFRGNNGKSYVLSAFCAHLGANLGVEGRVVHDSCIQCPFHAWTFDGETGNCVVGKQKIPKEGIKYEYEFDPKTKKCEFNEKNTEQIKIKKYISREYCGFIYVWFHAKKEDTEGDENEYENFIPPYEPLDFSDTQKTLSHRGVSLNKVNCHMSDIAENGGDILHFLYIHNEILPVVLKGSWDAQWVNAADPKLREKMALPNKKNHEFRKRLLDKYINEENKQYIGVIHLSNQVKILNSDKGIYFFTLTGFQVGPGLVYLFLDGLFFQTTLFQYIKSKEKYQHDVYHEIYTNSWTPYWFSALQLRLEVRQVLNDGVVWDNKKFGYKAYFNKNKNDADDYLIKWRKWYSQFYEGCKEEEEKKKCLDW
jgi:cholesterol 7-dehydrogenase